MVCCDRVQWLLTLNADMDVVLRLLGLSGISIGLCEGVCVTCQSTVFTLAISGVVVVVAGGRSGWTRGNHRATLSSSLVAASDSTALIAACDARCTYRTFEGSGCLSERSLSAFVSVLWVVVVEEVFWVGSVFLLPSVE